MGLHCIVHVSHTVIKSKNKNSLLGLIKNRYEAQLYKYFIGNTVQYTSKNSRSS
jgi:hypothetical protein